MSNSQSPSTSRVPGVKDLLKLWLAFGLIGMFLPILVFITVKSGYLVRWHVFAQSPVNADQVLIGDHGELLARTASGKILSCYAGTEDGCWNIEVVPTQPTRQPCELQSIPFNLMSNPPNNFVDCIQSAGSYAEVRYTVLYALDQEGKIWRWYKASNAYDIIIAAIVAVLGVLVGIVVGSGSWSVGRFIYVRKMPRDASPVVGVSKSKWIWLLAAVPLLCVLVLPLGIYSQAIFPGRTSSTYSPVYTSAAATTSALLTTEANKFQLHVTPNPSGPAYDFIALCQSAEWSWGLTHKISCSTSLPDTSPSVVVTRLPATVNDPVEHAALFISLPASIRTINGNFPVLEIRQSDYFRSVLACAEDATSCDMVLVLRLKEQDGTVSSVGEWQVNDNRTSVDIIVDLSRFTGRKVTFWMELYKFEDDQAGHTALLIEPRIENNQQE